VTGPRPGPTMRADEEWQACRVCRRSLERLEDVRLQPDGTRRVLGVTWDHTQPDRDDGVNHAAEPVPYSEIGEANVRLRCDFCLQYGDVVWELPVHDFELPMRLDPEITDWGSTNNWACCGECADLINRGDWPRLTRRAARSSAMRNAIPLFGDQLDQLHASLKRLYREVRKHQAGPVRLDPLRARVDASVENTDSATRREGWR
jgi:hypothetical protein